MEDNLRRPSSVLSALTLITDSTDSLDTRFREVPPAPVNPSGLI